MPLRINLGAFFVYEYFISICNTRFYNLNLTFCCGEGLKMWKKTTKNSDFYLFELFFFK